MLIMESTIARAAGIGLVVLSAQISQQDSVSASSLSAANTDDLSAFVGSDAVIDTKALVETKASASDTSGCFSNATDSSGVAGWYSPPAALPHPSFDQNMGMDAATAGDTIALLSLDRVAVFALNAQQTPEFVAFSTRLAADFEHIAIAPNGNEIAAVASDRVVFFRRSQSTGWSTVSDAQTLMLADLPTRGRAITYAGDGAQLFVSTPKSSPGVHVFQRNVSGNWEISADQLPGKFSPMNSRPMIWTADRLIVSDSGGAVLVFKRAVTGFAFSHVIGLGFAPTSLSPLPNGFAANILGYVNFYRFNGTLFDFAFQKQGFSAETWIATAASQAIYAATDVTPPLISPMTCRRVQFFAQNTNALNSQYILPNSLGFNAPVVIAGPWGVIATVAGSGSEVYLMARDRIFGGQNPPLAEPGKAGQGSFE
jgi:hypothetical protein